MNLAFSGEIFFFFIKALSEFYYFPLKFDDNIYFQNVKIIKHYYGSKYSGTQGKKIADFFLWM